MEETKADFLESPGARAVERAKLIAISSAGQGKAEVVRKSRYACFIVFWVEFDQRRKSMRRSEVNGSGFFL